jgi:DNA primase
LTTLAEAIATGMGDERPFRCTEHDDTQASASVNVLKGVWYCHVCHSKGHVDSKKAPSVAELEQMMEPEKIGRVYSETYLEAFTTLDDGTYWPTRFPPWTCWAAGLGEDPVTGEATFPVRTPSGRLAGVGRRQSNDMVAAAKEAGTNPSRYRYPRRWSASRSLHDAGKLTGSVMVLVEGAADQASLLEVGIPARAVYGSGLHHPQVEILMRSRPDYIVLAMDSDAAGQRGKAMSHALLMDCSATVVSVDWPRNDPAECTPQERIATIAEAVGTEVYVPQWSQVAANMQAAYLHQREEMQ